MIAVAPGLFYRHLSLAEVLQRQRARSAAEVHRHNAGVVEALDLGPTAARRDQVLGEFSGTARRLAR